MDTTSILSKIIEHQNMAAYHTKEATRLAESLGGGQPSPTRKGKLSNEMKAKLTAMGRRNKGLK